MIGASIPMRKQPTGEPVAGKPHTGFGGRGWRKPFPTPILRPEADVATRSNHEIEPEVDMVYLVLTPQGLQEILDTP